MGPDDDSSRSSATVYLNGVEVYTLKDITSISFSPVAGAGGNDVSGENLNCSGKMTFRIPKITKKRFIKLTMALGFPRNFAVERARECSKNGFSYWYDLFLLHLIM